jgi:hypothetical protein
VGDEPAVAREAEHEPDRRLLARIVATDRFRRHQRLPGIRYTGRLAVDPLGQMTLGEGTIVNGSGVQTTTNSRWGDYTDMTVDPVDDCTFWYVNEYYPVSGTPADTRPWHTRIASFKLPGCK